MLTPSAHRERVAVLTAMLRELEANPPPNCCLNCDNWQLREQACAKFGPVLDEHRAVGGCPEWTEELPF